MTKSRRIISLLLFFIIIAGFLLLTQFAVRPVESELLTAKVDPSLWNEVSAYSTNDLTEFIVLFENQADLSQVDQIKDHQARKAFVVSALREAASEEIDLELEEGAPFEIVSRLWVINGAVVRGGADALELIVQNPDVKFVYANPLSQFDGSLDPPDPVAASEFSSQLLNQAGLTYGIDLIDAEKVWAAGVTGEGAVVGGQDTGYDWDHPALKNQYRGYNAASDTVDHSYNWHDSIREDFGTNGNQCGFDVDESCDDGYHGTHTMGTMIGQAPGFDIGVAPDADWIGCRNMEEGYGRPSTYIECFEWFLAPTDLEGANPDSSLAPHVINNSWGCPPIEGCNTSNFDLMNQVVDNMRAAGIVVVVSAGNAGPGCSSVNDPAAIFSGSFSVGATDGSDLIAFFSSRGPVTIDGSDRLKPNVTAPGVGVWSAIPPNSYSALNGTSMAAPHVAGVVALMISADPSLAGRVELIETILEETAIPLTTNQTCGGDTPTSVPNHVYGHGRVDAHAAYQRVLQKDVRHLSIDKSIPVDRLLISGEGMETRELVTTISIENRHPISTVTGIVMTDTLPTNGRLIAASGDSTFDSATNSTVWQIPTLQPGETYTATVTFQVDLNSAEADTLDIPAAIVRSTDIVSVSSEASQIELVAPTNQFFAPFLNLSQVINR
ncbi:MAG: S8 family serine peptidase [Chloroflexota bacterium]